MSFRFALLIFLTAILVACHRAAPEPVVTTPPTVALPESVARFSPEQAASWITDTAEEVILDVREDWERREEGMIAGAQAIDFLNDELFAQAIAKLDPAKPYLLYCSIGGRSQRAAVAMKAKGFTQLAVLNGGFDAWVRSGKPWVKVP